VRRSRDFCTYESCIFSSFLLKTRSGQMVKWSILATKNINCNFATLWKLCPRSGWTVSVIIGPDFTTASSDFYISEKNCRYFTALVFLTSGPRIGRNGRRPPRPRIPALGKALQRRHHEVSLPEVYSHSPTDASGFRGVRHRRGVRHKIRYDCPVLCVSCRRTSLSNCRIV
jgi:hypothetical protein